MRNPFSIFLGLVLVNFALASSGAAQAPKIGYVDVVKLVERAPQGEKARKKLEQEFGPRDKEVIKNRKKLRALEKELENLASSAGDVIRRKKERELVSLRRNLKRASQEFREDYNLRRNEELGALQKIVYKAIVDIAKSEGFDLVLHEGAVYASDRIDITDKVLQKLRGK
ncbi:MAG: OmpH family outer membrane protein [Gammaproteobacteria bacterium]|nr:OmpH family outer membrane protein [Gammaproteobacteria bacterium]